MAIGLVDAGEARIEIIASTSEREIHLFVRDDFQNTTALALLTPGTACELIGLLAQGLDTASPQ